MASKFWRSLSGWNTLLLFLSVTGVTSEASLSWSRWSRWSSCSVTCGRGIRVRKRQCIDSGRSSLPSGCNGPREIYSPCQLFTCPDVTPKYCNCGCDLRGPRGSIASSLPYKDTKTCRWSISATSGTNIELTVSKLELNTGWLRINSGGQDKIIIKPGPDPKLPTVITSENDKMMVEFVSYMMPSPLDKNSAKLRATYREIGHVQRNEIASSTPESKGPNVPAIAGITACAAIILIAALVVVIRRLHHTDRRTDIYDNPEPPTAFETEVTPQRAVRNHLTPLVVASKGSTSSASGSVSSHKYPVTHIMAGRPPDVRHLKDSAYESEGQRYSQDERDNERTPWKPDHHQYTVYQQPPHSIRFTNLMDDTTSVVYHVDGTCSRLEPPRTMRTDAIIPEREVRI